MDSIKRTPAEIDKFLSERETKLSFYEYAQVVIQIAELAIQLSDGKITKEAFLAQINGICQLRYGKSYEEIKAWLQSRNTVEEESH